MNASWLPGSLNSRVLRPGDPGYPMHSSTYTTRAHPAAVLLAQDTDDIATALNAVRTAGVPVSVRSGGHALSGRSSNDGGLVVDLSRLNKVEILDRERRLVRVGAGARWGEVAERLAGAGLAISSGDHGNVGVGGLATGGGIGWLARSYGLTIDHVVGADVITTDGRRLRAAPDGDTDLYWALRGAGAGVGAVTSFDIEAVELGDVAIAQLAFTVDADGRALTDWASALTASPRELSAVATLMGHGGDLVLSVTAVVATADESAVRDALAPMLDLRPLQATAQLAPYTALVSSAQQHRNIGQQQVTSTTAMLRDVDDATAYALAQVARDPHQPILQFRSLGGAVNDIEPGTTAFAHRAHQFLVVGAVPGSDQATQLAKAWDPLLPHADGAYMGFETRTDSEIFDRVYPGITGTRVRDLWRTYDSDGILRPLRIDTHADQP
ncbi:FAD-binding oxidoreductase [Streptomyces sp. ME02-8801-2C]|uniref:FAD-binding oxidoreductase n=1 Tax=Streptomyces sp. ME02-8801-2C TaxID=3028680 RepID=UPI0029BFA531|nr:FAD-binding oxidoreductase [Streptomyces sp. ME02-8801-2C]MDX3453308.1 FAD-binding oxidoreductase [Streptomyces sp. ME02-8801-2C]